MELAATIAVIASVLVFAYQARELARQSRLANEVAGTRAHREMIVDWKNLMDVFVQYPTLRAYYYDQAPNTPSQAESIQLEVIAQQHADWLESVLATTTLLASYQSVAISLAGGWDNYIPRTIASSSLLRSTIRDGAEWPALVAYIADYDASEVASREQVP